MRIGNWYQGLLLDPYRDGRGKREARKDGRLNLPPWAGIQPPEFIRELFHVCKTSLETLERDWHVLDERLLEEWQRLDYF